MTLNEAITEGLLVAAVGLSVVFSVLIILMLVLVIMKSIFNKQETNISDKKETVTSDIKVEVSQKNTSEVKNDLEIVAVITAAIATMLNTSTSKIVVRSYKRIGNNLPAWNKASITEGLNTRL